MPFGGWLYDVPDATRTWVDGVATAVTAPTGTVTLPVTWEECPDKRWG